MQYTAYMTEKCKAGRQVKVEKIGYFPHTEFAMVRSRGGAPRPHGHLTGIHYESGQRTKGTCLERVGSVPTPAYQ